MDNEVSNSIHIAVNLMVVSVIIGMLVLFNTMSQNFGRQALETIAETHAETYATELVTTSAYGAVPVPSVYVMLEKNGSAVRSISGYAYGRTITSIRDLTYIFDKKIRISITEIHDVFDIVVEEE